MLIFDRRICSESLSVEFGYTLYISLRIYQFAKIKTFPLLEITESSGLQRIINEFINIHLETHLTVL
jgi:hypothetical protein